MSRGNKPPIKDMYWFAHGGAESPNDDDLHNSNSPSWNTERKGSPEVTVLHSHTVIDGSGSSGPTSLEREDRLRAVDKRQAVEERRKQRMEAEQERNDAALKKRMEREAAFEARRNAQRSNIAFAFGSSVPRNVEVLQSSNEGEFDMSRSFTCGFPAKEENHDTYHDRRSVSPFNYGGHNLWVDDYHQRPLSQFCTYSERKIGPPTSWLTGSGALIGGDDIMSRSMTSASPISPVVPRGRRKNDLMPAVPYERNLAPTVSTSPRSTQSSTRKRSVSMTRLDLLAQPRKHYVEATKASSTTSNGTSGAVKDLKSPTRPLSSASENSGGSGRVPGAVTRRVRSSPRKPRPISIAGTIPDAKSPCSKPFEPKLSPVKRSYTPSKRTVEANEVKKAGPSTVKSSTPKAAEKSRTPSRPATAPKPSVTKAATPKPTPPKPKLSENKQSVAAKSTTPKTPTTPKIKEKKPQQVKKKIEAVASPTVETKEIPAIAEKENDSILPDGAENGTDSEKTNAKHIISEEEAKAALAEKRRLAREQAEREAELERQRQEQLKMEEEERLRQEEEDQRKMEEESNRLLEEHRRQEEEKLRKAIEEQEQKEAEEKAKREEEARLKAEQEKKAKEEAEKQRLELEEKLRKEEEERAERKKRLEKIMSRTRGKSSGTSPSGSVSGSDQLDSGENAHEGFSSGANSLDSNEAAELPCEPTSMDDNMTKAEVSSAGDSMENNPTYEITSENESLNSNDLMMPLNETASQENSLVLQENEQKEAVLGTRSTPLADEVSAESASSVTSLQEVSENRETSDVLPVSGDVISNEPQENKEAVQETSLLEDHLLSSESGDHPSSQVEEVVTFSHYENLGAAFVNIESAESELHATEYSEKVIDASELELPTGYELNTENFTQDAVLPSPSDFASEEHSQFEHVSVPPAYDTDYTLESEFNAGSSISSDIKLPDPIYETSDDGSVSSEKQLHDFKSTRHQEEFELSKNTAVVDDVFSEQTESHQQQNPFGDGYVNQPNPFGDQGSEKQVGNQFGNFGESEQYDMSQSLYEEKETFILPDVPDQSHELEVGAGVPTLEQQASDKVQQMNFEAFESQFNSYANQEPDSHVNPFAQDNEGAFGNQYSSEASDFLNKSDAFSAEVLKSDAGQIGSAGDNPFQDSSPFGTSMSHDLGMQGDICDEMGNLANEVEKVVTFEENAASAGGDFFSEKTSDVTFIKEDGSGACIGIISSVDHDHISNDFPKPSLPSEQLKNKFESASITDSEDSSLDSNLSQVMTVETSENVTDGGLNHISNSTIESNSSNLVSGNGEQHNNPFGDHIYNNGSISKSNGSFSASEVYSNGHGLDSSKSEHVEELPNFLQLGGNDISSVDHSKNNMYDNVDALEFSKVSSDPFLGKGNSTQISGNPFLL